MDGEAIFKKTAERMQETKKKMEWGLKLEQNELCDTIDLLEIEKEALCQELDFLKKLKERT